MTGFDEALAEQAAQLGGRTLSALPGNMSALAPQIEAADRVFFFTSPDMGNGLTAAEMAFIQGSDILRAKSIFVYGYYPQ